MSHSFLVAGVLIPTFIGVSALPARPFLVEREGLVSTEHREASEMSVPTTPLQEIGAVLDDFHDAAAKADFTRYFSHWTDESVFLGTDATERWTGKEFREFAEPHFKNGKGWTYWPRDRRITLAGSECAFFDELLGHEKLGLCRGSGVMRRVNGEWKVLQYNLSIPVPNDLADGVVRMIRDAAAAKPDPNVPRHIE